MSYLPSPAEPLLPDEPPLMPEELPLVGPEVDPSIPLPILRSGGNAAGMSIDRSAVSQNHFINHVAALDATKDPDGVIPSIPKIILSDGVIPRSYRTTRRVSYLGF